MYETNEVGGFRRGDDVVVTKGNMKGSIGTIVECWSEGEYLLSVAIVGDDPSETWSFNPDEVEKR